jgi:hypothetical protein
MVKFNNPILKFVNALLLIFGCLLIGAMLNHQNLVKYLTLQDSYPNLSPVFNFFLNPYFRIFYGVLILTFIGKEFFIKKPIKAKIKINIISVIILVILLGTQMMVWHNVLFSIPIA